VFPEIINETAAVSEQSLPHTVFSFMDQTPNHKLMVFIRERWTERILGERR